MKEYLKGILSVHYAEAAGGLLEKSPSRLNRGEGTEWDYFILKVDIVGSTYWLKNKHKSTYLKLAHTFLSSVDKITQDYGADARQAEYAGDSVMAYFPADTVTAEQVTVASCLVRKAVSEIRELDDTLKKIPLNSKIVLHHATLIVARIGPWANSTLSAIGLPLHTVAHLEKSIGANVGFATKDFVAKLDRKNLKFFEPIYTEEKVLLPLDLSVDSRRFGSGLFGLGESSNPYPTILNSLLPPSPPISPEPRYEIKKTLKGYALRWALIERQLGL